MRLSVLTASAGWGLYSGWSGRRWGLADELIYHAQPRQVRVATGVGWFVGLAARMVYELSSSKGSDDSRQQSSSGSSGGSGRRGGERGGEARRR